MSNRFQAIRGFNDVLPVETSLWQRIEHILQEVSHAFAYQEIKLPIIEQTGLFKRTIGEVTDIVEKEMYTFLDMNGDSISLRPEGTAGCVRAVIEHGMLRQPQKLWYLGPMFRHEKPQKGRYRQFHQFGVEVFGIPDVSVELELLAMTQQIWNKLGLQEKISLEINGLGTYEDRLRYRQDLVLFFQKHLEALSPQEQLRLDKNPLRLLDSKSEVIQALLLDAPKLIDYVSEQSRERFNLLCQGLDAYGITYQVKPFLVRGLDYYHDLVFEWVTPYLGSQATVCAGGRYNGLVAQLGGPDTPAVGFAMGIERIILLLQAQKIPEMCPDIFLLTQESQPLSQTLKIADSIRIHTGLSIDMNLVVTSFKSQFKKADKSGAQFALILGEDELQSQQITVKRLRETKEEQKQWRLSLDELIRWLNSNKEE